MHKQTLRLFAFLAPLFPTWEKVVLKVVGEPKFHSWGRCSFVPRLSLLRRGRAWHILSHAWRQVPCLMLWVFTTLGLPCYLRLLFIVPLKLPVYLPQSQARTMWAGFRACSHAIKPCLPRIYIWRHQFICRYIECVTLCKRKNRFESRCEGWQWCGLWRESCWCIKVSFLD